jgi:hypothetical protein
MKKHHLHHGWLVLATYGVWFALFSGLEEIAHGKLWKLGASLILGILTYYWVETRLTK